jgi:hypothetical protein
MKKIGLFVIPVFAVIALLTGVFVWKIMTPSNSTQTVTQARGPLPDALQKAVGSKPSNPFGGLFGQPVPLITEIPSPTPASAAQMNADLQSVGDDGGAADVTSLQSVANGL